MPMTLWSLLKTYFQMKAWGAWSCAAWAPWAAVVSAMLCLLLRRFLDLRVEIGSQHRGPKVSGLEGEEEKDPRGGEGPPPLELGVVVPVNRLGPRLVLVAVAEPGQHQVRDDEDRSRHHQGDPDGIVDGHSVRLEGWKPGLGEQVG